MPKKKKVSKNKQEQYQSENKPNQNIDSNKNNNNNTNTSNQNNNNINVIIENSQLQKEYTKDHNKNLIKNNETINPSTEEGFTGNTKNWFSNEQYYSNLPGKSDIYHEKDYYFNSYSSFYIHEEMIKDKVRTGTYQKAILENKELFANKIVLDIGCGTGILSIFAAQAGATHVYGIEFADIADFAKEIVKKNKLENKITIIKSKVEDANLPVKEVDIIISEWMGYFLLYESMLDTVLYARDRWLKKNGLMLPDRAMIYVAALQDESYKFKKIDGWNDVYGFKMTAVKNASIAEPLIDICNKDSIISNSAKIYDINLYKIKKEELDFVAGYEITFNKNEVCNGLVTWFDVEFSKLNKKFTLRTGPFNESTHWKQVVFYIENDVEVNEGEKLHGNIAVIKDKKNFRFINTKISYHFDNNNGDYVYMYKIS